MSDRMEMWAVSAVLVCTGLLLGLKAASGLGWL